MILICFTGTELKLSLIRNKRNAFFFSLYDPDFQKKARLRWFASFILSKH